VIFALRQALFSTPSRATLAETRRSPTFCPTLVAAVSAYYLLFVADSYGLLAEHAELQIAQLLALAADKDPDDDHQII